MLSLMPLENFGVESVASEDTEMELAYQRGYEAGAANERDKQDQSINSALSDLSQSISDFAITFEEARLSTLESLGPFFKVLTENLLPSLKGSSTVSHVCEILHQAACFGTEKNIVLKLSLEDHELVSSFLTERSDLSGISVEVCPDLKPGQIKFINSQRENLLDTGLVNQVVREGLNILNSENNEENKYG